MHGKCISQRIIYRRSLVLPLMEFYTVGLQSHFKEFYAVLFSFLYIVTSQVILSGIPLVMSLVNSTYQN